MKDTIDLKNIQLEIQEHENDLLNSLTEDLLKSAKEKVIYLNIIQSQNPVLTPGTDSYIEAAKPGLILLDGNVVSEFNFIHISEQVVIQYENQKGVLEKIPFTEDLKYKYNNDMEAYTFLLNGVETIGKKIYYVLGLVEYEGAFIKGVIVVKSSSARNYEDFKSGLKSEHATTKGKNFIPIAYRLYKVNTCMNDNNDRGVFWSFDFKTHLKKYELVKDEVKVRVLSIAKEIRAQQEEAKQVALNKATNEATLLDSNSDIDI